MIKWIKIAFYEPQLNKATRFEKGHLELASYYNTLSSVKELTKRESHALAYHTDMASEYSHRRKVLIDKIQKIRNS